MAILKGWSDYRGWSAIQMCYSGTIDTYMQSAMVFMLLLLLMLLNIKIKTLHSV